MTDTTSCALVAADRARPGTAQHVASKPAIDFLSPGLGLPATLAVCPDSTWALVQTWHAAAPTPERPQGAAVATADPNQWSGSGISIVDVRPQ